MLKSLRYRIVFLAGAISLTSALVVGGINYFKLVETTKEKAIEDLVNETNKMALSLNFAFEQVKNDLLVVEGTPPVRGVIRCIVNKGPDPMDGSPFALWHKRLEMIFTSVMVSKPYCTQMRFIGIADNGKEILRVNRIDNKLYPVPLDKLQEKGNEPYFKAGIQLPEGSYSFSKVTYNREHGVVESTLTPTIRLILPVYYEDDIFGLLVMNLNYEAFLQTQFDIVQPQKNTIIINQQGDYMPYLADVGPQKLELAGAYSEELPSFVTKMMQDSLAKASYQGKEEFYTYQKVRFDPVNPSAYIGVILHLPNEELFSVANETRNDTLVISAGLMLLTLLASFGLAAQLTRPLPYMTQRLKLAKDNLHIDLQLPTHREDEIGELARAFNDLSLALVNNKKRYQSILKNASDGVITFNQQGEVLEANPAVTQILGYNESELRRQNIQQLLPNLKSLDSAHPLVNTKKITNKRTEVTLTGKDGVSIPVELSFSKISMVDNQIYTVFIRDISDRIKFEKERDGLIKELEISNQELDNFAYVASHDLKAPLRVIDNASKWLEEDLEEFLNDDTRESLELLRNRVTRMEKLLDDLLDYSRIGRNSDDRYKENVTAKELLLEISDLLKPKEGLKVVLDDNLKDIEVKRMPLQQILLNLINNAIKHHDKETGEIRVSAVDNDSNIIFKVMDDGPGIAEEFHEKIFKMFQTLKPRDQVEGSGMGLAMVHKYLDLNGGKIDLESSPGKGSTFIITWPKKNIYI